MSLEAGKALVAIAREIARVAHADQTDKAGAPYLEHVSRVARSVCDDLVAEAVAWLHDVVEDCPEHIAEVMKLPLEVVRPVVLLTRLPSDKASPDNYYARIKADPVALRVKLADLSDNSDEQRLARLSPELASRLRGKYRHARALLDA